MKKTLILFLFYLVIPQLSSAYDDETTHPGLTEQVVEFYNLNNSLKIGSADKELIIQGSIDEDNNPATRPLNHFYDPTRNMGINDYRTALDWATAENNGNEFSWNESIRKYAAGDREGALIGLGHILHLIEDMTVPDHTRNDPHMGSEGLGAMAGTGDSLYENWAKENKTRETMKGTAQAYKSLGYKVRNADSIEGFFKAVAFYSNNNYVSPDSIENSIYRYPFPEVVKKKGSYAYGSDSYFYDEHKVYIDLLTSNNEEIKALVYKRFNSEDFSVLEEYFTRLSKMAILSGTGVVELFFSEAENARTAYLEAEAKKQAEQARLEAERNEILANSNFLTGLWYQASYAIADTVSAVVGAVSDSVSTIGSSIYNGGALAVNDVKNFTNSLIYTGGELATIATQKIEQGAEEAKNVVVSVGKKAVLYVEQNSSSFATPALAYNPPAVPAEDSSPAPDMTQGQIVELVTLLSAIDDNGSLSSADSAEEVTHSGGGHISHVSEESSPATSTASTTDETATSTDDLFDDIATSTATSTEETATSTATSTDEMATSTATSTEELPDTTAPEFSVELLANCLNSASDGVCLIATTTADFILSASSTDISYYTIGIDGETVATTSEDFVSLTLDPDYYYEVSFSATDNSGNVSEPFIQELEINLYPLVINEVAWMGTATSSYDEWIELANRTSYDLDLSGWTLSDGNDIDISLSGSVDAGGYYLLERTDDTTISDITADQIYAGALSDEGEVLTLSFGSDIMDQTPAGGWPAGDKASRASMERTSGAISGTETGNWVTNPGRDCNGLSADPRYPIVGTPRSLNSRDMPPPMM